MSRSGVPRWLEEELSRRMMPAEAPDGLWDRVGHRMEETPELREAKTPEWARWAIAAALTVATAAGSWWLPGGGSGGQEPPRTVLAVLSPERPEQRSADWTLRCALPENASTYRLAELSARRIPIYTIAMGSPLNGSVGCYRCHATVWN